MNQKYVFLKTQLKIYFFSKYFNNLYWKTEMKEGNYQSKKEMENYVGKNKMILHFKEIEFFSLQLKRET